MSFCFFSFLNILNFLNISSALKFHLENEQTNTQTNEIQFIKSPQMNAAASSSSPNQSKHMNQQHRQNDESNNTSRGSSKNRKKIRTNKRMLLQNKHFRRCNNFTSMANHQKYWWNVIRWVGKLEEKGDEALTFQKLQNLQNLRKCPANESKVDPSQKLIHKFRNESKVVLTTWEHSTLKMARIRDRKNIPRSQIVERRKESNEWN